MTEYIPRVVEVKEGEPIEIPDDARDVEITHHSQVVEDAGIGGSRETEHFVRVKYLEKVGRSVR